MSAAARPTADRGSRAWASVVALVGLIAAFTLVAGLGGTVAGLATAIAWYGFGTPYAIAAGCVVLAGTGTDGSDPGAVAVVALAFLALVLAPLVRRGRLLEAAVAVVSAGGFVGTAWYVGRSQPPWVAAGTLLAVVGLAIYTLHRYELVRLGLVSTDQHAESQTSDT